MMMMLAWVVGRRRRDGVVGGGDGGLGLGRRGGLEVRKEGWDFLLWVSVSM